MKRDWAKNLIYQIGATALSLLVVFAFTGQIAVSVQITVTAFIVISIWYAAFEKLWKKFA